MRYLIIFLVLFLALFIPVFPALAWEDCPLGLEDDPYPGSCPRYIDTNNDGICDHSQPAPTSDLPTSLVPMPQDEDLLSSGEGVPTDEDKFSEAIVEEVSEYEPSLKEVSLLSKKELGSQTILDLEENYQLPAEPLVSSLAEIGINADPSTPLYTILRSGSFSRSRFLSFLNQVYLTFKEEQNASSIDSTLSDTSLTTTNSLPSGTPSTSTLPIGAPLKGGGTPPWWKTKEAITIFSSLVLLILIKALVLFQERSSKKRLSWFTDGNYRLVINIILMFSFTLSFVSGFLDFFSLNFNLFLNWASAIVALHYISSFPVLIFGIPHTLWHIPYYRGIFRQRGKLYRKNKKALFKWILNIFLGLSFGLSLLSGLLNYLSLHFHWIALALPSLKIHLYSSFVMMGCSLPHIIWHLSYYLRLFASWSRLPKGLFLRPRSHASLPTSEINPKLIPNLTKGAK